MGQSVPLPVCPGVQILRRKFTALLDNYYTSQHSYHSCTRTTSCYLTVDRLIIRSTKHCLAFKEKLIKTTSENSFWVGGDDIFMPYGRESDYCHNASRSLWFFRLAYPKSNKNQSKYLKVISENLSHFTAVLRICFTLLLTYSDPVIHFDADPCFTGFLSQ
jgi:hypothetical protein